MYKFNFTTITPLHISNGEVLEQNFHYTTFQNIVYKIDLVKFAKLIAKNEKIDFSSDITANQFERWVKKYQINIVDDFSIYSVKVHKTFDFHLNNKRADGKREIKEFINSNRYFYIPASSVKGAIITVLNKTLFNFSENENGEAKNIIIKQDFLGIKEIKYKGNILVEPSLKRDKFVLYDSNPIDGSKFSVFRFDRPPAQNLICLDPGVKFTLLLRKEGNLDLELLKNNLTLYSKQQMEKAIKHIQLFERNKGKETKGSSYFKESLKNLSDHISNLRTNEYLINIGFGGGAYFKLFSDVERIPKNTKREFIHTSYTLEFDDNRTHIGWCKLEIEEL